MICVCCFVASKLYLFRLFWLVGWVQCKPNKKDPRSSSKPIKWMPAVNAIIEQHRTKWIEVLQTHSMHNSVDTLRSASSSSTTTTTFLLLVLLSSSLFSSRIGFVGAKSYCTLFLFVNNFIRTSILHPFHLLTSTVDCFYLLQCILHYIAIHIIRFHREIATIFSFPQ